MTNAERPTPLSSHDHGNCELCECIDHQLCAARARIEKLEKALHLAQNAMRAPFDDWKGILERKALDAARDALADPRQQT